MQEPRFWTFFPTVLMVTTLGFLISDLYIPSLPSIREAFNTGQTGAKLTLSLYLIALGVTQLYYGPLSDRVGRRKVIVGGLGGGLIGTLLCFFSQGLASLLVGRVLQGLALGVCPTVGRAIIRDAYKGERLAHVGAYLPVGTALILGSAPIIGGYIEQYLGWRANFMAMFLYNILLILMALIWLPETNHFLDSQAIKWKQFVKNYQRLLKDFSFLGYSACSLLALAGLMIYFLTSPFIFIDILHFDPDQYGWLAVFVDGGVLLGGFFNGAFIKKFGRHWLLSIGTVLMFLGGGVMLIFWLFGLLNLWVVMFPMLVYSFGMASTFANSFAGALHSYERQAGFASALFGFLQIAGGACITVILSAVAVRSQFPLAIMLTVLGFLAYLLQKMALKMSLKRKHK